ncbi:hypothetical protein Tco_0175637 [Tanacetum coccineum]
MSQPANDEFSQHLSDDEASNHEDASDTGAAPKQQQQVIPQTTAISNIKLPILKKEEYDIWAMEMEHYLEYIDNDVWKVIQNGNSKKRFQLERWCYSNTSNRTYEKIQEWMLQKKSGEAIKNSVWCSTEDANHKFLKILCPALVQSGYDYENLNQILTLYLFKSSTNKVKSGFTGAYSTCTPFTSSTNIPEKEALVGFADEVIYSLFAKQSENWDLLHEDLEQIDDLDIEEININWQIAMICY